MFDAPGASRREKYLEIANHYYNLVTDVYEAGYGSSFHFAPRYKGDTQESANARLEHHCAYRVGLKPDMNVVDIGSGVGGPMRNIARFSGAEIVGINCNAYQLSRTAELNFRGRPGWRLLERNPFTNDATKRRS